MVVLCNPVAPEALQRACGKMIRIASAEQNIYNMCEKTGWEETMSKSSYRIPLFVAVGLKLVVMIITWGMLANQPIVYQALGLPSAVSSSRVSTPNGGIAILNALFYVVFLGIVLKYQGEQRRLVSVIAIILYICFGIGVNLYGHYLTPMMARDHGAEYMAAYSALNALIGESTMLFNSIATALFYISAGRYGVSDKTGEEEIPAPQYQNYQP